MLSIFAGETRAQSGSSRQAEAAFAAAAELQNSAQYDLAVEDWERFLRQFPRDALAPKARYYLAVSQTQLGNHRVAVDQYRELLRTTPDFDLAEDALLSLGWCEYMLGAAGNARMLDASVTTFKRLAERFPESARLDRAHFYAGEAHYAQGNRQQAIAHYARIINRYRDSRLYPDALYAMGVAYEELGQFARAGRVYDRFLRDRSDHELATEVTMRKAETVLQTGDAAAAERAFAMVSRVPNFAAADHAVWRQAFAAAAQDAHQRAAQLYERLIQDFPQSAYRDDAALEAARAYYRAGRFETAAGWFGQILASQPSHAAEAAHWLAQIHLTSDQPEQAQQVAERGLALADPGDPFRPFVELDRIDALAKRDPAAAEEAYLRFAADRRDHELAPQALYNAAFTRMELQRYEPARAAADQFLRQYPQHELAPDVTQIAAESAIQTGELTRAGRRYQQLLAAHPNHPDRLAWQLRRALVHYLAKEYQEAIHLVEPLLRTADTPETRAEAEFIAGVSHFGLERYSQAAAHLRQSTAASLKWGQADEAMFYHGRALHEAGEQDEAIAVLNRLPQAFPASEVLDQATYYVAEAHFAAGRMNEAADRYRQLLETWPSSSLAPHSWYGLGWAEMQTEDWEQAAAALSSLLEKYPRHALVADTELARGMVFRRTGDFRAALASLDAYLAAQPRGSRRADALFERALVADGLEKREVAIDSLQRLLQEHPDYERRVDVLYELAWLYKRNADPERARAAFDRLTREAEDHPLAAEAHFHVGESYYDAKRYNDALAAYRRAAEGTAKEEIVEQAQHKLGWTHYRLEEYATAEAIFRSQIEAHPDGALARDARFMAAEALYHQGAYRRAADAYAMALETPPDSDAMRVLLYLHGGQAAAELEQWQRSLDFLNRIPTEFPETPYFAEALFERARVFNALGKPAAALEDFEQAAILSRGAVGARSRFMVGEHYFERKELLTAIKHYRRVIHGYGGKEAGADVRSWQAFAAYEAARCEEIRAQRARTAAQKEAALNAAADFYRLMLERDPQHELAADARQRLSQFTTASP